MNKEDLYISEDGKSYAVLVSPNFGAGWSTWGDKKLAYDRRIIKLFLSFKNVDLDEDDVELALKNYGFRNIYMGGWSESMELVWVPFGVSWYINEYDGAETLIRSDDKNRWTVFYEY